MNKFYVVPELKKYPIEYGYFAVLDMNKYDLSTKKGRAHFTHDMDLLVHERKLFKIKRKTI